MEGTVDINVLALDGALVRQLGAQLRWRFGKQARQLRGGASSSA
jgi:hypothetical protein